MEAVKSVDVWMDVMERVERDVGPLMICVGCGRETSNKDEICKYCQGPKNNSYILLQTHIRADIQTIRK